MRLRQRWPRACAVLAAAVASAGLGLVAAVTSSPVQVACVGDSITRGAGVRKKASYPSRLQALLGPGYRVQNWGRDGASSRLGEGLDYRQTAEFRGALKQKPEIVVLGLGTNDAKRGVWQGAEGFAEDYLELVERFRALPSRPRIVLLVPPPVYKDGWNIQGEIANDHLPRLIPALAKTKAKPPPAPPTAAEATVALPTTVVDVFATFEAHCPIAAAGAKGRWRKETCDWILDGVHPNAAGYAQMATLVGRAILAAEQTREAEQGAPRQSAEGGRLPPPSGQRLSWRNAADGGELGGEGLLHCAALALPALLSMGLWWRLWFGGDAATRQEVERRASSSG